MCTESHQNRFPTYHLHHHCNYLFLVSTISHFKYKNSITKLYFNFYSVIVHTAHEFCDILKMFFVIFFTTSYAYMVYLCDNSLFMWLTVFENFSHSLTIDFTLFFSVCVLNVCGIDKKSQIIYFVEFLLSKIAVTVNTYKKWTKVTVMRKRFCWALADDT